MLSLKTVLRALRGKPRRFHVLLLMLLAWAPTLLYFAGHVAAAAITLAVLAAVFFAIHPVTFAKNHASGTATLPPAANDE